MKRRIGRIEPPASVKVEERIVLILAPFDLGYITMVVPDRESSVIENDWFGGPYKHCVSYLVICG